jgi:uncharacterized lipoprotein YajG
MEKVKAVIEVIKNDDNFMSQIFLYVASFIVTFCMMF